jgi:hypothetical protein
MAKRASQLSLDAISFLWKAKGGAHCWKACKAMSIEDRVKHFAQAVGTEKVMKLVADVLSPADALRVVVALAGSSREAFRGLTTQEGLEAKKFGSIVSSFLHQCSSQSNGFTRDDANILETSGISPESMLTMTVNWNHRNVVDGPNADSGQQFNRDDEWFYLSNRLLHRAARNGGKIPYRSMGSKDLAPYFHWPVSNRTGESTAELTPIGQVVVDLKLPVYLVSSALTLLSDLVAVNGLQAFGPMDWRIWRNLSVKTLATTRNEDKDGAYFPYYRYDFDPEAAKDVLAEPHCSAMEAIPEDGLVLRLIRNAGYTRNIFAELSGSMNAGAMVQGGFLTKAGLVECLLEEPPENTLWVEEGLKAFLCHDVVLDYCLERSRSWKGDVVELETTEGEAETPLPELEFPAYTKEQIHSAILGTWVEAAS